jgi:hypothetical protein
MKPPCLSTPDTIVKSPYLHGVSVVKSPTVHFPGLSRSRSNVSHSHPLPLVLRRAIAHPSTQI